jgi:hypothetical protein
MAVRRRVSSRHGASGGSGVVLLCTRLPVAYLLLLHASGVPRGGGVQPPETAPHPSKFRSLDEAEPNSQFRGKYIRNNLIRMRGALICK